MSPKALPERTVGLIEAMECLHVTKLPEGEKWTYELKLDGYRLEVVRSGGETTLYSRSKNILNQKFPYIATALRGLPDGTVIDGELVALGADGHPDFRLLQNFRSAEANITYYAFDILMHKNRNLTMLPPSERRQILRSVIKPAKHIALSEVSNQTAAEMMKFVRSHGLEGIIAKRSDSVYQLRQRTGLWSKNRINLGQEFVIGGYTPGTHGFDALVIGVYQGNDRHYAARVRTGFVPATRRKECVWLRPEAVARFDFLEWTAVDHLRHTKFIAMRDDKDPSKVVGQT